MRMIIKEALSKSGYNNLIEANDGEEACNIFTVSYTHLRAHETKANLVCRLLLEKKKNKIRREKSRMSGVKD
ncbi:hypothetical protein CDFC105_23842 [Clostridioides difficile]|nr:hypothetical protein CDFC105_23842 [Clostridioides difficile]